MGNQASGTNQGQAATNMADNHQFELALSDGDWKKKLSAEQYYILRQKGTERAGTGKYDKNYDAGVYRCAGCENPLFSSTQKFKSGSGWPSFYDYIPGSVLQHTDSDGWRTEILCKKCGGHLGHVFFNEGFNNPTNQRHCVNSGSLKFDTNLDPKQVLAPKEGEAPAADK